MPEFISYKYNQKCPRRVPDSLVTFEKIAVLVVALFAYLSASPQSQSRLAGELEAAGFENIRIKTVQKKIYVSAENRVYRRESAAVAVALDYIAGAAFGEEEIELVVLRENIPHYCVSVRAASWQHYREGKKSYNSMTDELEVAWTYREAWDKLKNQQPINRTSGKADVVLFPHLAYENTQLDQIYEYQLNVSPLVDLSLWRGGSFSGQLIIPLHNELGYEGDFLRPGYVTVSQQLRITGKWLATLTAGNFSNSRYGSSLRLVHPFANENWVLEFKSGLTGSSHFYDHRWIHGSIKTLTWESSLSWFYSPLNLEFSGGAAQYIYGDKGLFGRITRFFGETAIELYAQINEYNKNAGFRVTLPFLFKKRFNRRSFRITLPKHMDITYNAGTELYYGQSFRSDPLDNAIKNIKFIRLIKKRILNPKK